VWPEFDNVTAFNLFDCVPDITTELFAAGFHFTIEADCF
jgi:hypothetical protein